jgi:type I restriction enzyme M protein
MKDATRDLKSDLIARWLVEWTKSLGELREAREIPRSTTRFAALQSWLQELWGQKFSSSPLKTVLTVAEHGIAFGWLISQIAGAKDLPGTPSEWPAPYERHRPEVKRLERLSGLPMNLAQSEMRGLLEQVRVSCDLQPSMIEVGRQQDLQVRLRNESALALRNFRVKTVPFESEATSPVLDTDQEITWTLPVTVADPGQLVLHLEWSGQRLDDSPISGESEIGVEAVAGVSSRELPPLGSNPYVIHTPIGAERPDIFYGREDILDRINRSLRKQGPAIVLLLEGVRRSGKTSILKQLVEVKPPEGWVAAYWSSQQGSGEEREEAIASEELFYGIAAELILAAHKSGINTAIPIIGNITSEISRSDLRWDLHQRLRPAFKDEGSFELLDIIVEALTASAKPRRFLLVLDEFDKIQNSIRLGVMSPQVPENMRYLFHSHSGLSGIISGSPEIKRLRQQYWGALFGIGDVIRVSSLDSDAAARLVVEPTKGLLVYAPSAVDLILSLSARQPYLIQLLCDKVFDHAAVSGDRSVTVRSVEAAADDVASEYGNFRFLWQSIGNELRRYIVCLVDRLSRGDQRITLDLIAEVLEEDGLTEDGQLVGSELQELIDLELICLKEDTAGKSYGIAVPLFSYWLRKNVDDRIHREAALNARTTP